MGKGRCVTTPAQQHREALGKRFRVYDAEDCGVDGYPLAWHESIKDAVREAAGHRCVRCGHPYRKGEHGTGEWSACDFNCDHGGPVRVMQIGGKWEEFDDPPGAIAALGGSLVREARWRILTVHHLTGDKRDLRWWNLAALCQRCHLQIQGRVNMAQVYPHEHSKWFRPYAAGYYAAMYLGEDLTREETITRLDELLQLEQSPA
jgi:hypothetical protein